MADNYSDPLKQSHGSNPLRSAIGIAIAFTTLAMGFSFAYGEVVAGAGWFASRDVWFFLRASHYVANGALGYMYESTEYIYALPLYPILLAPVAFISEAFHLSERLPYALYYPTSWLLLGPYCLATASFAISYAGRVAVNGMRIAGSRLAIQALLILMVVVPAMLLGHFEDALAVAFVLLAFRGVLDGKYSRAALLLSLAIAFKQWAVLGLPPFVALLPSGLRIRSLVLSMLLPVGLAAFTLSVDWNHASQALLKSPTFPEVGHAAPWLRPDALEAPTLIYRVVALGVSMAVALRLRHGAGLAVAAAGFATVFLVRAAFEPVPMMYYLAPGLTFLMLHERLTRRRMTRTMFIGVPLLGWFLVRPDQMLWWVVFIVGVATLALPALRDLIRRSRKLELVERVPALAPTALPPG